MPGPLTTPTHLPPTRCVSGKPSAQELVSKYHEWLKSLPLASEDDRKSCVPCPPCSQRARAARDSCCLLSTVQCPLHTRTHPLTLTLTRAAGRRRRLPLRERLALMEWSVLTQSDDLRRTKALFLREKEELQHELQEALAEASLQAQHAREARIAAGWASPPSPSRTRRRRPAPDADAEVRVTGNAGEGGAEAGARSKARNSIGGSREGKLPAAVAAGGLRGVACTPMSTGSGSADEGEDTSRGDERGSPIRPGPVEPQATEPATVANGTAAAKRPAPREGTPHGSARRTARWQDLMRSRTPGGARVDKGGASGPRSTRVDEGGASGIPDRSGVTTAGAARRGNGGAASQRGEEEPSRAAAADSGSKAAAGRRRLPEAVKGEWAAYVDPSSGRHYYFNLRTRTTQWETPESFRGDAETE